LRVLKQFRDGHGVHFVNSFRAARMADEWLAAMRMAHTVKGLAHSIGAAELGRIASQLEQATKEPDIEAVIVNEREIELEFARVMSGLMRLGKSEVPVVTSPTSVASVVRRELLDRLLILLEARDTAATSCMEEFSRAIADTGVDARQLTELSQAVQCYDYERALWLLEQLPVTSGENTS